jgi:hypothetical protein
MTQFPNYRTVKRKFASPWHRRLATVLGAPSEERLTRKIAQSNIKSTLRSADEMSR